MNEDQFRAIVAVLNGLAAASAISSLVKSEKSRAVNGILLALNLASVVWMISRIGN